MSLSITRGSQMSITAEGGATERPAVLSASSTASPLSLSFLTPSSLSSPTSSPSPPASSSSLSVPSSSSSKHLSPLLPAAVGVAAVTDGVQVVQPTPSASSPSSADSRADSVVSRAEWAALQARMDSQRGEKQRMDEEMTQLRAKLEEEQQRREAEDEQRLEERQRSERMDRQLQQLATQVKSPTSSRPTDVVDAGSQVFASATDERAQSRASGASQQRRICELEAQMGWLTDTLLRLSEDQQQQPSELLSELRRDERQTIISRLQSTRVELQQLRAQQQGAEPSSPSSSGGQEPKAECSEDPMPSSAESDQWLSTSWSACCLCVEEAQRQRGVRRGRRWFSAAVLPAPGCHSSIGCACCIMCGHAASSQQLQH